MIPTVAAPTRTAREALDAQLADDHRRLFGVSLDALWRACGKPRRQSPEDWAKLASPVLYDLACYRRRLHAHTALAQVREYVARPSTWTISERAHEGLCRVAGAGPVRVGDLMADAEVASLYALYLDRDGVRREETEAGLRSRESFVALVADLPPFVAADLCGAGATEPAEIVNV